MTDEEAKKTYNLVKYKMQTVHSYLSLQQEMSRSFNA